MPKRQGWYIPVPVGPPPNHPKGTCRYCGKPLTGRQRKWCCPSHGHKYYVEFVGIKVYWSQFRNQVLRRDHSICKRCGGKPYHDDQPPEVHHIVPVSKGGAEFDMDNCETLCWTCHHRRVHSTGGLHPRHTRQRRLDYAPGG